MEIIIIILLFLIWIESHVFSLMFCWEQLSGANVMLVEDRPDVTQKIIQISGTPEQAERAQSLLQGFILSSKSSHNVLGCGYVCSHACISLLGS